MKTISLASGGYAWLSDSFPSAKIFKTKEEAEKEQNVWNKETSYTQGWNLTVHEVTLTIG